VTLAVPDDLRRKMRNHPEIKWSEVARKAMWEYVNKLDMMDELTKSSKLTEDDALDIGREIKASLGAKYSRKAGRR
jgi:predicted translin family RNA/ssDNA-binding protein